MFNELFLHFLKSLWKWIISYLENNIELCNLYICGRDCVIKCLPAINFWCIELTAGFFLTIYALAKWPRLAFSTFFFIISFFLPVLCLNCCALRWVFVRDIGVICRIRSQFTYVFRKNKLVAFPGQNWIFLLQSGRVQFKPDLPYLPSKTRSPLSNDKLLCSSA